MKLHNSDIIYQNRQENICKIIREILDIDIMKIDEILFNRNLVAIIHLTFDHLYETNS